MATAGLSWKDLDGDSGFVSADVELDKAEHDAGVVAVLSVRNGKDEAGVYVTRDEAGKLAEWLADLAGGTRSVTGEMVAQGVQAVQEEFDERGLGSADLLVRVILDAAVAVASGQERSDG